MNPHTISFNAALTPGDKHSDLYLMTPTYGTSSHPVNQVVPAILEDPEVQLVSVLAHEVRNPLTNINLAIELLRAAIKEDDLNAYLDIISRSSTRINDLIKELLKYQHADEVLAESHSVQSLLEDVLEMARDRLRLKNIRVRKDYAVQDCKIVLHRPKMKIALTNMIINAIDAMPAQNGKLKLITKSMSDRYILQIEDNGCGMSPANLKNIFKPFFTNKPGGVGLGLATTYDILRANRVGINVESIEREGTRFTLMFEKKSQHGGFNA